MAWRRFFFKGNKVYAEVDAEGNPCVEAGRVQICYKPGERTYQAAARNLRPVEGDVAADGDEPAREEQASPPPAARSRARRPGQFPAGRHGDEPIIVYTDGACRGNPGPAGLGAVLISGDHRKELSEYLGARSTNNIAELTAVRRALEEIKQRDRRVIVHTDSEYVIGMLSRGWKARANGELISEIRELMREFSELEFVKVPAHAGVEENERADQLGNLAIAEHHG